MSAEVSVPLNFATFFICGIKKSTGLTQLNCINLLLTGVLASDSIEPLSDPVCSNYAKGKKPLTSSLRVALTRLTIDEAKNRLIRTGIQDLPLTARALTVLLKNSSLSQNEKNKLLGCYKTEDALTFTAQVFLASIKGDNNFPLGNSLISRLENYRYNADAEPDVETDADISIYKDNARAVASDCGTPASATFNDNPEFKEDFDWMRNYISNYAGNTPPAFLCSKVKIETALLTLPQDYASIIYTLKPMLTESTYRRFTMDDFAEVMNIDLIENKYGLQAGSLEYWHFEGEIESILTSLEYYNFSEMSDFAFQLIGEFTENDVDNLKKQLMDSSNPGVNILASIIFDREPVTVHLMLFAHRCAEKVNAQKSGSPFDCTHEYIPQRSRGAKR